MDLLFHYPLIYPANENSQLACQAQQLLKQIDWTYYTIWRKSTTHNSQGLVWSTGEVNGTPVADERRNMGLLLQQFYRHCSFLPLGFGKAGEAFASGQYRWASGEELLLQIRFLSSQNQLPAPPELHVLYFKTVVYIPLENGAGVLEIGTKELVSESELGRIYQIFNKLAIQGTSRGDQTMSSSFQAGTIALPNDFGNQYGDPDEQYKIVSMKENYGDSAIFWHPSIMSSYWSSTSTSSSTPSASDLMGNNSNTTFAMNTSPTQVSSMNNEDMLISLQATPNSMVNSFDELDVLNQLDQIDTNSVSMPISLPIFNSYGLNNADSIHYDHHDHLRELPLNFSSTNLSASLPLLSPADSSRYLDPHSGPNHNHLLECVFQPIQCAFSARNDVHIDAHHCLNEIVRRPSIEPNMACQTEAISISCLPSVTCTQLQASSHSASFSNDHQHQKWRHMFPSINEGEKMNDLFRQSEEHVHATVSAVIANSRPLADRLGDKRLEANIDHRIMQEQGAALMTEEEGSTRRNGRENLEGYETFIDDKMSKDQGEKVVVSSIVTSTRQTAGSYVGYASGSAEAGKVVSYVLYASGSAEAEKGVALSTNGEGGLNIGSGNRDEHYRLQHLQGRQQDGQYIATPHESNANFVSNVLPAQVHHMHAERNRRRRQRECINTLCTLVPNITKKANKVEIFQRTIRHLEELKGCICELEQDNSALMNLTFKDRRKSLEGSSHCVSRSQHDTNVKNSRQNISSQENATCYYAKGTMPHFRLSLMKNVEEGNVNATIMDIISALQKENLYCCDINSKFWKDTSKISIDILANHKDEGNYCPTLDEIQHVEQWWKHLT